MDYNDKDWKVRDDRAQNICKIGQGAACCRYLARVNDHLICARHDARLSAALDRLVDKNALEARSVNCEGVAPFPVSIIIEA